MAHAYTPGLKVRRRTRHRAKRLLPIAGNVRVKVGDRVEPRDVVAETFMPGDVLPINLANQLSAAPADVPGCMLKEQGDRIEVGDVLARTKGIFGMFKSEYAARVAGTIETISGVTGQVLVRGEPTPVRVLAYLAGEVVEIVEGQGCVVEAEVAYVQGIFGIGGEAYGPVRMACAAHDEELGPDLIQPNMRGAVIVGGARMTGDAVRRAIEVGAAAIVSGGMDDQDLRDILGYDLGVAVTGSERIGVSVIVTEGFGEIAMAQKTFDLFAAHEGDAASVNGTTQIRAGVMRPEVVIGLTEDERTAGDVDESHGVEGGLDVGRLVRIIRDPHFGLIGKVAALPSDLRTLASESKARVLEVEVDSRRLTVPRANVELIEE
ncbi:MAG: hypothetical protein WD066_07040 [Planctomycetaceae bacterium]